MSQETANSVDSIIYIISAFISPVLGFLVDYTGRNLFWVLVAILITQVSHAMLAFTFIQPLVAMIIMGIGYSVLACALWPMVSLVIPTHQLGTAYGIMQSVQNLGLGCVVLAAGYIVDLKGNIVLEIFFLAWISCKPLPYTLFDQYQLLSLLFQCVSFRFFSYISTTKELAAS